MTHFTNLSKLDCVSRTVLASSLLIAAFFLLASPMFFSLIVTSSLYFFLTALTSWDPMYFSGNLLKEKFSVKEATHLKEAL
ncbi:MAG: hypothetical protein OEZ58_00780 [Gammaproteobacteria bacterium]|nr:hypothetical protein [Gammaproteobacteria bacterium]